MESNENQEVGPTRDDNSASFSKMRFQADMDQQLAAISEKLKSSKGYQVTFSVLTEGKTNPDNFVFTNNFPSDIRLSVHRELKEMIVKQMEGDN